MPYQKDDRVQSPANLYDEGTEDRNGLTYSQQKLAAGLGHFCFGTIVHVYKKVGRQEQW